ncbi:MAG: type VI secretion system-associated FHA domain protein TagH [Gammaproteobacteria bacterium]|nr:type VI secretion system-associated FHA domain protein TagH [Gammaproteobacteria bacterium]
MSITFTITNQPAAVPGQELSHTFTEGGTLGRTRTCDWVLIDASRFISGKHAVISEQNGVYQITDTSTNGVFINDAKNPLGKGNSAILNNGDMLKIGEYVIKIAIDGAQPVAAGPGVFQQPASTPPADLFGSPQQGDRIVGGGLEEEPVDVLDLFSKPQKAVSQKPVAPPPPESGFIPQPKQEKEFKSTQGSNAPSIQNHFMPPNIIPDNWLEEENKSGKPKRAAEYKPPPQPQTTRSDLQFPSTPQPATSTTGLKKPAKIPELTNGTSPFAKKKVVKKTVRTTGATSAVSGQAVQAFLAGLGLEELRIPPDQIPAFMRTAGEVLRESISGTFNVLRSRTNIKSEFRMSMTTIQAVENNPLKFSINVQEAIRNMFLNTSDSYLPPVDAMREGFEDIEGHQLAVMAGTQAAIAALMKRFQPDFLEDTFDRTISRAGLLPGGKKAKYWDAFEDYYRNLAASVEDNFQNMFGEEFARAYENQVNRLLGSKRRK